MTLTCPDCHTKIQKTKNKLSDEEWTYTLDCPNCSFEIETESNLAYQERKERLV